MGDAFDLLLKHLERLLSYPAWLPIERHEILFYCDKLRLRITHSTWNLKTGWSENMKDVTRFEYNLFTDLVSEDGDHISSPPTNETKEDVISDSFNLVKDSVVLKIDQLGSLVTDILDQKNESTMGQNFHVHGPPNLSHLGAMVRNVLSQLYYINRHFYDNKDEYEPNFYSGLSFDKKKFQENIDREICICVGFEDEARHLLERLAAITLKQLEVISIVGMAGLGKTTLARKVYDDPLVVYHFYIRAWVHVSQVYQKRDLLLGILSSFIELTNEFCIMSANKLAEVLYRSLKGKRYLIVVDDIWNIGAWEDIKRSFPNDHNGSRIMLTTRLSDVALHAQSDKNPQFLRFLTEKESWDLFKKKVCVAGGCFDATLNDFVELDDIGKKITRKCHGLPLAIVVVAGVLKNNFKVEWWEQVSESVSSYIVSDPKQYMDTLALSYNHLPRHLKPCFLYLGAFPEEYEIPLRKLIWLWIAEGFICQSGGKSLEEVAEDYLTDLLKRSLVVVAEKGSNGGIKTCRVHDLLRELCLRIAEEDNFAPKTYRYMKNSYSCLYCLSSFSSSSHSPANSQLDLRVDVIDISSKCSASEFFESISKEISMIWEASELLRALDLSCVQLCIFPSELMHLVRLRYLELQFTYGSPPETVSNLIELETLIISSSSNIIIPANMWKMVNMRHLYIRSGENRVEYSGIQELPDTLENLQTLSLVSPSMSCGHILSRTPNLRKLGFCGPLISKLGDLKFPDLCLLNQLETLKLLNTVPTRSPGRVSGSIMFPIRLKRLTVSNTTLEWKEAWIFEMIPNLEVLKLKVHAFAGKQWETSDGVFRRLKFLKLEELDISNWRASRNHFPMLRRLVVNRCPNLKAIPSGFGNISTLEWIELSECSDSATRSARDIQKEQENNDGNWLKILINPKANSS